MELYFSVFISLVSEYQWIRMRVYRNRFYIQYDQVTESECYCFTHIFFGHNPTRYFKTELSSS